MPIHGGCLRRRHPKAAAIRAAAVPAGGCCLSPMQGERVALFIVDKRAEARNGDVGCNLDGGPIADEAEEKVWPDIAQFGPRQSVCRRYAFDLFYGCGISPRYSRWQRRRRRPRKRHQEGEPAPVQICGKSGELMLVSPVNVQNSTETAFRSVSCTALPGHCCSF